MSGPLRIAQVAPPLERVPPDGYGGTERIVAELVTELGRRGHEVTTFASGDLSIGGRHVPTIPRAIRPAGLGIDPLPWFVATIQEVLTRSPDFDVIHSHLEVAGLLLAAASPVPVVSTFHGRLDTPALRAALPRAAGHLVAISQSQASPHPDVPWAAVIHNGLTLRDAPFERRRSDALAFVGRVAPEKGIVEAIEIAKLTGRPLRMAAKVGTQPAERAYDQEVFRPALARAGSAVEYFGELSAADRDRLFAESFATLMPGSWPEPFGLVAIESLACGTPVVARRTGALPEILREGEDGFFGDDVPMLAFQVERVGELDRAGIRRSVLERFSARRMTDRYEELYRRILAADEAPVAGVPRSIGGMAPAGAHGPRAVPIVVVPGRPVMRPRPREAPGGRRLGRDGAPRADLAGGRRGVVGGPDGAGVADDES